MKHQQTFFSQQNNVATPFMSSKLTQLLTILTKSLTRHNEQIASHIFDHFQSILSYLPIELKIVIDYYHTCTKELLKKMSNGIWRVLYNITLLTNSDSGKQGSLQQSDKFIEQRKFNYNEAIEIIQSFDQTLKTKKSPISLLKFNELAGSKNKNIQLESNSNQDLATIELLEAQNMSMSLQLTEKSMQCDCFKAQIAHLEEKAAAANERVHQLEHLLTQKNQLVQRSLAKNLRLQSDQHEYATQHIYKLSELQSTLNKFIVCSSPDVLSKVRFLKHDPNSLITINY